MVVPSSLNVSFKSVNESMNFLHDIRVTGFLRDHNGHFPPVVIHLNTL
jgi:hypothetical protein